MYNHMSRLYNGLLIKANGGGSNEGVRIGEARPQAKAGIQILNAESISPKREESELKCRV